MALWWKCQQCLSFSSSSDADSFVDQSKSIIKAGGFVFWLNASLLLWKQLNQSITAQDSNNISRIYPDVWTSPLWCNLSDILIVELWFVNVFLLQSSWRLKGMALQWPKEQRSQTSLCNNCGKHNVISVELIAYRLDYLGGRDSL